MRDESIRAGVRRLLRLPLHTPDVARADADAELESLLDERVAHLVARGVAPDAARAEALRRLGMPLAEARAGLRGSAERRERRAWLRDALAELAGDVRFALRKCGQERALTTIAVVTLALGIGANTAIFSVVHRLLLAPLPYRGAERLVMPMQEPRLEDDLRFRGSISSELTDAWRARTRTVDAIAGASMYLFNMRPDGTVDTIPGAAITASFLPLLGVEPVLGRSFVKEDERDAQPAVAMISHALWQRAYGGRPDAIGRTVAFDGQPLTIVGVTPPGLSIPLWRTPAPDVWMPATLATASGGGNGALERGPGVIARMRPGVTADAVSRELQVVAASLPASPWGRERPRALRARDFLGDRAQRALQVLFAAVGALLLIACLNVANLLLARATTRQREFAVRGALGAGRGRLVRQLLVESLTLALAGGALGVGVAWLALRVIVALRPPALADLAGVRLEPTVLLWTLGISVVTGVVFGAAPALFARAQPAGDVLRRETRGGSAGRAARRARSALIVLEIGASLVLLVAGGLLVRSFAELQRMPLGFEPRGLVYTSVLLGDRRWRDQRVALREAIFQRLRALPGVTDVAVGVMPGRGFLNMGDLEAEGASGGELRRVPMYGTIFITPEYFRVARIALLAGRLPGSAPPQGRRWGLTPEVLVNRALARQLWPDGHAIGAHLREASGPVPDERVEPWSTVVGIVDDTRMPEVRGDVAAMQVYSIVPPTLGELPIVVRTAISGDVAAPRVKHAIAATHPALYVRPMLSGDTYLRDGLAPTRFAMALIAAFALVALAVAAVGLYGVVAYGVAQRTREIGIRVALGATPAAVLGRVMGSGVRLAVAGVAVGGLVAAGTTRLLAGMLFDVSPLDPLTFGAIALLVVAIALVASWVPARRALRIDPAETLRAD